MRPFVGPPTDAPTTAGCAYSAALNEPACGAPIAYHLIGRSGAWGWVALYACRIHLAPAEAACVEIADVHPAAGCAGEHYAPTTSA